MFVTHEWWEFAFRWLHIISGVMWIGLLWYFNFVQTPSMPKIPDEQKPAISKVIAPTLGIGDHVAKNPAIGLGMWLGAIMWFNVWFIIWPNQKKALGNVNATPDEKKKAGRVAGLTSR